MVEWLAGNRIRGTSTERTSATGFNPVTAVAGGWKEIGRTTLGSAGDIIDVTSLPDKRYYMLLTDYRDTGGQLNTNLTLNNDTGNNYARRWSTDGAGDSTQINRDSMNHGHYTANDGFAVAYLSNLASKEKLFISHSVVNHGGTGSGTSPNRNEWVGKWTNTSNAVSRMTTTNTDTGTYDTGSEVVVLGWDPDDTHTTNFWEELASVELSSADTEVNSGVFTSKKYLWVQAYIKSDGSTMRPQIRVGNTTMDSGTNYAWRGGENGTDYLNTSADEMCDIKQGGANTDPVFFNGFIVNNSANEKLMIGHSVIQNTAGAGYAPKRIEIASKWTNTSNQINVINVDDFNSGTNFGIGSIIKVWGSN